MAAQARRDVGTVLVVVQADDAGDAPIPLDGAIPPDERVVVFGGGHTAPVAPGVESIADLADLAALLGDHAAAGGRTVVVDGSARGASPRWWRDLLDAVGSVDVVAAAQDTPAVAVSAAGMLHLVAAGIDDARPTAILQAAATLGLAIGPAVGPAVGPTVERRDVLLSACMIMKDEEENVERCLTSLRDLVDEIVIYDTGSTDRSIEIARSLGARVIEGTWNDDFAAARNAAREACRGRWLLHIDLDEQIEHPDDTAAFRAALAADDRHDVIEIVLYNLGGTELAATKQPTPHWLPRLLRRRACRWDGAIHEVPLSISSRGKPRRRRDDRLSLLHRGYLLEVVARRGKAERNRRIAETRTDDANPTRRAFEIARANVMGGRIDEALASYETVVAQPDEPILRRVAMEQAATILLERDRGAEAKQWIERRAAVAEVPGVARWLRARLALLEQRHEDVLTELDGITAYTDHFSSKGPATVHMMRTEALVALERLDDAADELLQVLDHDPLNDTAWMTVLRYADRWPHVVAGAASRVPADGLKLLAGKLLNRRPDVAALVAEHLWASHPGSNVVLALAIKVAPSVPLDDAARWAVRIRAAGLSARCPLRIIANDAGAPKVLRLQAAYLGAELFGDADLQQVQHEIAAAMSGS
jgi:hypothetical protein